MWVGGHQATRTCRLSTSCSTVVHLSARAGRESISLSAAINRMVCLECAINQFVYRSSTASFCQVRSKCLRHPPEVSLSKFIHHLPRVQQGWASQTRSAHARNRPLVVRTKLRSVKESLSVCFFQQDIVLGPLVVAPASKNSFLTFDFALSEIPKTPNCPPPPVVPSILSQP